MNAMLTFVEPAEDDRGKGHGPDPIIHFFEGDIFAGERGRDKQRLPPRDIADLVDAANFGVARIRERRQLTWQRPRRGLIARRRHGLVQRLMRSLVVVGRTEPLKATLLRAGRGGGRAVSALSTA